MMTTIVTILFSLLGLGVLIIIHELGHLLVAKLVGMKVEAFGIGFGRPLVTFKVKDIVVHISWIPFGGYVKIAGMDEIKGSINSTQPDAFFSKSPFARMAVAFAGPLANLLFCLLAFGIVWIGGGRSKPFSFATDRVGIVDQSSALYKQGLRPGDRVLSYGGQEVTSSRDHFRAAMTAIGPEVVATESLMTQERKETTVSAYSSPLSTNKDLKTFGVLSPASFVVWMPGKSSAAQENSLFQPSDRIVWVNGETIFSFPQLKSILNRDEAYLTIQRGEAVLHVNCARCRASDLKLSMEVRGELTDWMFEGGITSKKVSSLFYIPYNMSQDCVIEKPLDFLNQSRFHKQVLLPGDKILALWGVPVAKSFEVLRLLQRPAAAVIVERGFSYKGLLPLPELDHFFVQPYRSPDFTRLIEHVGLVPEKGNSSIQFLPKVPLMTKQELLAKEGLSNKGDEEKELYLGLIGIQDMVTRYNPSPKEAVQALFEEITSTMSALFSGTLSPKLMSGPVGIVQILQQQWAYGFFDVLFWLGAISFNLALINLLPLPVLDGGYIFMSFFEIITFGKLSPRISGKIVAPFAFLLIGLLLYLTYHDIVRLLSTISS